jgi:hypothetical protein
LTFLIDAAAALLLPASVMTLAVTDSLREAIDPARLFAFARKIGRPYLVLFLALLLLMSGSHQAFELVAPLAGKSPWLLGLAGAFVGKYFFFIMCAMMGYVLLQYSDELGLQVTGPDAPRSDALLAAGDCFPRRDAVVARLLAAGDLAGARAALARAVLASPDDLALQERARRLEEIERRVDQQRVRAASADGMV